MKHQKTALVFDIDGTLLDSEGIDGTLFVQAVKDELGDIRFADDWTSYTNVTDVGILSELLESNGREPHPEVIDRVRERFRQLLNAFLVDGGSCPPIAGVPAFLHRIGTLPGISIGIATGGWGVTARMKLAAAKIDINGIPLSSSEDRDDRTRIMEHCLANMKGPFNRTVYIGDGIWDRDASISLGWHFIGIGKKLQGKCPLWFKDFTDIDSLLSAILPGAM